MKLLITILVLTTPLVLSLRNQRASWYESRNHLRQPGCVLPAGCVQAESYIGRDIGFTNAGLTSPWSNAAFVAAQKQFSYFNSQPQFNYHNQVVNFNSYQYPKPWIPFEAKTTIPRPYPQVGPGGAYFGSLNSQSRPSRPISPGPTTTVTITPSYQQMGPGGGYFGSLNSQSRPSRPISPGPTSTMTITTPDPQAGSGGAYIGSPNMPTRPSIPNSPGPTSTMTITTPNPQSGSIVAGLGSINMPTRPSIPNSPEMTNTSTNTPGLDPETSAPSPQQGLAVLFLDLATPATTAGSRTLQSGVIEAGLGSPNMPTRPSPLTATPRSRPIPPQPESIVDLIQMRLPDTVGTDRYMIKGYFIPYRPNDA